MRGAVKGWYSILSETVKELKESIKEIILPSNGCSLDSYFAKLEVKMQDLIKKCDVIERKLDRDIQNLTEEIMLYKSMLHTVANTLPDMMWCKDLAGRYMYANDAIKQGLLFDSNPIGKTDVEMAINAKHRFGFDNHTFGEKCANSDVVVIDKVLNGTFEKSDGRFLESGKIKGKMLYLEVFKAPLIIDGVLVGTVGIGRDMTEYVTAYRQHSCGGCAKMSDVFSKYEFEG